VCVTEVVRADDDDDDDDDDGNGDVVYGMCVCVCVCARIDNDDKADPGQRTAGRTRARGTYVYVVHLPTLSVGLSSFITCPPCTHWLHACTQRLHTLDLH